MATLLVTGGAGYVGSHAARFLTEAGHEVVVYDSLVSGHREAVRWGQFVPGDLLDREKLAAVFGAQPFDGVLHFAALIQVEESVREPDLYWRNNVEGSRCLLDAMEDAGVEPIVFSSSACVYGEPEATPIAEDHPLRPDNPYGDTKLAMEREIAARRAIRGICLRYFNAAGAHPDGTMGEDHHPESHLLPNLLKAGPGRPLNIFGSDYPTPDGTAVRDYVHVWDLAAAHGKAMDHLLAGGEGLIANLGTGEGYSVLDVVDAVEGATGWRPPTTMAPRRAGDVAALVASRERAGQVLGWEPRLGIAEIVADAHRWHRGHPHGYAGRPPRREETP